MDKNMSSCLQLKNLGLILNIHANVLHKHENVQPTLTQLSCNMELSYRFVVHSTYFLLNLSVAVMSL